MVQDIIDSVSLMTVNGSRLELPKEQLTNYARVKATLQKAGGKYKKNGFDFGKPAQEIKDRLCGGEKIDDKKKFQFFPTPPALAKRMVGLISAHIVDFSNVLEPSAGQGAILDELDKVDKAVFTAYCELNPENVEVLKGKGYHNFICEDFLKYDHSGDDFLLYDAIVANPPFTNNQDIDHIRHMYDMLEDGGRIVTISSCSWVTGSQKKQVDFREWLHELGATLEELPKGTFKESGTSVRTMLIIIDK